MKLIAILVVASLGAMVALAACTPQTAEPQDTSPMKTEPVEPVVPDAMEKTIYVGPTLVDCVGVAPQRCMQVKESPEDEYTLFFGQIEGFEYQEGNEYVLLVREEKLENPPADAPDRKWVLVSLVSQAPVAAVPGVEPTAQTYTLDWYLDDSGEKTPILTGTQVTLQVDQNQISGSAGCNSYTAQFELDGDQISIGPAITTMMACPEPVMQQESAYLAALGEAAIVSMAEGALTFADAQGRVILSYHAVEPLSLLDTLWDVVAYNNGKGGVTSVLAGTSLTALFLSDGNLSGSAGCNNYTASFQTDGQAITIGPAATTRKMCAEPAGVMEQEAQFLAALGAAKRYEIQMDRMIFFDEQGSRLVEFQVNALIGTTWNLVEIQYSNDTAKTPADPAAYNVTFEPDGTLSVKADCNRATGSYTLSGSSLSIRLGPTTAAMCPPESLSSEYLENLAMAASYLIEGDTLYIAMQMDAGIMKFVPAQ